MTRRTHFAYGDYVTRYPADSEYVLEIESPFEKPGWKPRTNPAEFSSAIFPGSAVEFEQNLYEVVDFVREPKRFRYHLRLWDARFPVRIQFHYSAEECAKLNARRKKDQADAHATLWIKILSPFVGMLPASDQKRIENRFGISSSRLTLISALTLLLPAAFGVLSLIKQVTEGAPIGPGWLQFFFKLGVYFFLESIARLISCLYLEEPLGSLPVYFVIETYRMIRRNLDPGFKQTRLEKMETGGKRLINAVDQVREVQGKDFDLEITSILPKPHWSPLTGIRYNGLWYGFLDSEKIGKGDSIQYRFRLKRAPEGMVFSKFCEYTPDEVQELYRQKQRLDAGTWIATFSPLWGLLDGNDQRRLQEIYGFDAMRYTRWTIVALGLLGFFNLVACMMNFSHHLATRADAFWLIASSYLLLETYVRWSKWKQQEPSGSLLGILVQPFANSLMKK